LAVTTRTIRRDLTALQIAGFPIYDDDVDGVKCWRLDPKAMGALGRSGLTFAELCALYFSRALLECFAGTYLQQDLQAALDKVEGALSPAMKKFLNRLPRVISAKGPAAKKQDRDTYRTISLLFEASVGHRVVSMRYDSAGSGRTKEYAIHPYRLVHAQGGLYLIAFVPAYGEVRTFAVERIRRATVDPATFEPVAELDSDPFRNSMGVFRGPTVRVQLKFHASIAATIRERTWHSSQVLKDRSDGGVTMLLDVSDDYALRAWILGFGRYVRVVSPPYLADSIQEECDAAATQYAAGHDAGVTGSDAQPGLPFLFNRLASA
jgi:predicted DNA-binding transcriptional regulator YafY